MTITYNLGIPASGNNPSQDQPNMQTNTNSISTLISVDHVGFAASGVTGTSGRHNQVTFDSNNVPSTPVNPPVLFTNDQDGSGTTLPGGNSELFFYSGSATASQNQYFIGANGGSVLLMQGMILKWGTRVGAADNTAISFLTESGAAFPNNCYSVQANAVGTTTSGAATVIVGTISASLFVPRILNTSGTPVSGTITWIAIGN